VIVDVPAKSALINPVFEMVATVVLLDFHGSDVAAVGVPVSCNDNPLQMAEPPEIEGLEFTDIVLELEQPLISEKVIVVVPAVKPFTSPLVEIVATVVLLDTHAFVKEAVPEAVNITVAPTQRALSPEITGLGLILIVSNASIFPLQVLFLTKIDGIYET
jgi:hypothetical protein